MSVQCPHVETEKEREDSERERERERALLNWYKECDECVTLEYIDDIAGSAAMTTL